MLKFFSRRSNNVETVSHDIVNTALNATKIELIPLLPNPISTSYGSLLRKPTIVQLCPSADDSFRDKRAGLANQHVEKINPAEEVTEQKMSAGISR